MKLEQIKELIKILENSSLCEISYKKGEDRLTLKKSPSTDYISVPAIKAPTPKATPDSSKNIVDNTAVKESSFDNQTKKDSSDIFYVESPLVGTFYQAPTPEAEPYVIVGSKIKKGDPLCIIEAMKIMNIIEFEVNGTIEEVYLENAHFVEYKSKIYKIRKS